MDKFSPKKYPVPITVIALIMAYGLAYLYEKSLLRLIRYVKESDELWASSWPPTWPVDIISSIVPIFVILVIFSLAWLELYYLPPSRFTAILFVLLGLIVIGFTLSAYIAAIGLRLSPNFDFPWWLRPPTILGRFHYGVMSFVGYGCRSSIYYIATGCIIIGIVAFTRKRKENRDSFQES